jgi:GNAT superfamily N-acetyltransferase
MKDKLTMKIIPFAEWRTGISPLWMKSGAERLIPHVIDGAGQLQYMGRERLNSIVVFPIAAEFEGQLVAWTSVYNISDEAVRIRGIFVQPEFRANGVGYEMVKYAMSLWPDPWKYCFMYARKGNIERYERWGFTKAPQAELRTWDEGQLLGSGEILLVRKPLREEARA